MTHEDFQAIAARSAAGAASAEEQRLLDEHVRLCSECQKAPDGVAEASVLIGKSLDPVSPPADPGARIVGEPGDADDRRFGVHVWWLATAATLFLALWGWREIGIRVLRERVSSKNAEIRRLAQQNWSLSQQRERLSEEMAALATVNTKAIALTGQPVAPSASASVFLEPETRRAVVFFSNLPQNPGDKSYQLWVLRGDESQRTSAGVFDVSRGSAAITTENLPPATEIKGLAVTLERRGGSEQPTNADYYVLGKM